MCVTNDDSNQEYQRGVRATEGVDPEGCCPYIRVDDAPTQSTIRSDI